MQKKTKKAKRITVQMNVRTGLKSGCSSDADCYPQVCRSGWCYTPCDTTADCPSGEFCSWDDICISIL